MNIQIQKLSPGLISTIAALALLLFGGTAQANEAAVTHYDGERPASAPLFTSLETVAASYWQARAVALPVPVAAMVAPESALEAAGRGELGGPRVWIATSQIPSKGLRWSARWSMLVALCGTYIHERGHNAGLLDGDPAWAIMGGQVGGVPPKCEAWAYRLAR